MSWTEQKVLITGGGSGVGLALARKLWQAGSRVVICGRDGMKLRQVEAQMPGIRGLVCDLGREGEAERLVGEAVGEMGGLTVLVNNAAVQKMHRFSEVDAGVAVREARLEVATNLVAVMELSRYGMEVMRGAGRGVIVNVGSGLGLAPKGSAPVYCATKAGLHVFTEAMQRQMPAGVRMMEVMLPLVDTPMTAGRGRGKLSAEEVADAIVAGVERGERFVAVGKVKLLQWLLRVAPGVAKGMMLRS